MKTCNEDVGDRGDGIVNDADAEVLSETSQTNLFLSFTYIFPRMVQHSNKFSQVMMEPDFPKTRRTISMEKFISFFEMK